MSMPIIEWQCNKCDLKTASTTAWCHFKYILPSDKVIDLKMNMEWCFDCKDLAPVENITAMKNKEFIKLRKSPPRCLVCGSTNTKVLTEKTLGTSNKEETEEETEKCIEHPGCSGFLIPKLSDLNINLFSSTKFYSIEGFEDCPTFKKNNVKRDFKIIKKLAKHGDITAQYLLGNCYSTGMGVRKDYKKSFKWYRKCAKQGNPEAQERLAFYYRVGIGVEENFQKAIKWYTKSADRGHAEAQIKLANYYQHGLGVEKNSSRAVRLYMKSAEQGNAKAQGRLAYCYETGYGFKKNIKEALKWYTKSAEQGNAKAQCGLGVCYYNGEGVDENKEKAVKWFTKSAEQGNAQGQLNLGVCYDDGEGLNRDLKEAFYWYTESANNGNNKAANILKKDRFVDSEKIEIVVLGSGSSGNSVLLIKDDVGVLIDAGFSKRELFYRLSEVNIDPSIIKALLITHEHTDHVKGARIIADYLKIPTYTTLDTEIKLTDKDRIGNEVINFEPEKPFEFMEFIILPFNISHDTVEPVGFVISTKNLKIGYAMDLGYIDDKIISNLKGCNALLLESNYDLSMLQYSGRPSYLINRIKGNKGHLSNVDSLKSLESLLTNDTSHLFLGHISGDCNEYSLVKNEAEEKLKSLNKDSIELVIMKREHVLSPIIIK